MCMNSESGNPYTLIEGNTINSNNIRDNTYIDAYIYIL